MTELCVHDLSAGYRGRPVLHGITLDYGPGLHLLLGPNGAGKTTLFRTLAGVLAPIRGDIRIDGRDTRRDVEVKALVGLSAHRAALAPRLTVRDNLRFWARVLALPASDRDRHVEDVLRAVELTDIGEQRAGTLSRGQSQRVGLAKALLNDPPVLLLDEPVSGVDPTMASRLRKQLRALADEGRTVLVSTHELAEVADLADDVTILRHGRLAGRGMAAALREEVLGTRYRVRLRGTGDLRGVLARLGFRAESSHGDGVVVEVEDDQEVETLVAELVRAGVGVREVGPADNALHDVYTRLQEQQGAQDAAR